MYKNKKLTITILASILILSPIFSFADFNNSKQITIAEQCEIQEAPSLFVFNALFANTANPYPTELWENRDNEQISIFDIAREIKSIAEVKDQVLNLNNLNNLNNTDDSDQAILLERLSQMEDIADRALVMEADKWKACYVNELMKHIIGIRNAGISNLIPSVVDPGNCKENADRLQDPCDENGARWTSFASLAGLDNQGPSIVNYMQLHGTDIDLIRTWWKSQVVSSWHPVCAAVKAFYGNQRTLDLQSYYWGFESYQTAEDEYSACWKKGAYVDYYMCYPAWTKIEEKDYINAFTIWHAYVQEVLSKTKFYHNDQTNKQVCLIRTTGKNSLKSNSITDYGTQYTMSSAVYDSFSLFNIYKMVNDKVLIESSVPHHRIIHLYPLLGYWYDCSETEVIVISGPDLPFDYFYNGDENLSLVAENLNNGEGLCKGRKLTKTD